MSKVFLTTLRMSNVLKNNPYIEKIFEKAWFLLYSDTFLG